jgi:3-oxoacyl-[acyl-carrier protein] reductase
MARRYEGKVVVVTGAAGGLGRALALGYAGEGAALAILDIEPNGLAETKTTVEALGVSCATYEIDLSNEEQIEAVGQQVVADFPEIDLLYNNAGIAYGEVNKPIDETSMMRWQFFLAVNTLSPLLFGKALKPALAAANGCIINQSSMAAYVPAGVYGVTKAALNQMTFGMASLWGKDGIRVNAIAPGIMETAAANDALPPEHQERIRGTQKLALHGTADDIVRLGLFLGSDDARFITGEVMHCDAGSSIRGWRY